MATWTYHNVRMNNEIQEGFTTSQAVEWVAAVHDYDPSKCYAENDTHRIIWDTTDNWIKKVEL